MANEQAKYEWLSGVCARPNIGRHDLEKPFTYTQYGQPYTVATSGHSIVELAGDLGFRECPPKYREPLTKILAPTPKSAVPISLGLLRAFIEGAMDGSMRSCGTCDSRGEVVGSSGRMILCAGCMGESVAPVRVYIGGILFNARLFELPLVNLPDTGTLLWASTYKDQVVLLDGGSWRLGVMPMRETERDIAMGTIPRFPVGSEAVA